MKLGLPKKMQCDGTADLLTLIWLPLWELKIYLKL